MSIRRAEDRDSEAICQCIAEMQDFERTLDPRLRPGASMAAAYWTQMQAECAAANGRVFVAEVESVVVGMVAVVAAQRFESLDDPPGTFALVTDMAVLESHRDHGIGRKLLEQAEAFSWSAGATELRIGVMHQNVRARHLYLSAGFKPHLEMLAKQRA
ncbi:MAG: GNAT family N-acetyltransferase [Vicinamibacterales bacterium]